jgi:hypothetical protein
LGSNHIVRRQRPPDPLQLELTDWLDLHGVLDLHQHARTDQDLTRLGFVASREATLDTFRPGSNLYYGTDRQSSPKRPISARSLEASGHRAVEAGII